MLQILSTSNETSTGAELVQNGNFSQLGADLIENGLFDELGTDVITNGNFATDTDWTKGNGWSIAGKAISTQALGSEEVTNGDFSDTTAGNIITNPNFTDTGSDLIVNGIFDTAIAMNSAGSGWYSTTGALFNNVGGVDGLKIPKVTASVYAIAVNLTNGALLTANTSYKITYEVLENNGSGGVYILAGAGTAVNGAITTGVTHTIYITSGASTYLRFYNQTNNSDYTITNVTCEELGADWNDLGSPLDVASYDENGLTITSANGDGIGNRVSQSNVVEAATSYKVTYTIHSANLTGSNTLRYFNGSGYVKMPTAITGTPQTLYYTTPSTLGNADWFFRLATTGGSTTDNVTISSISVQELGEGWSVVDNDATHYVEFIETGARFVSPTTSPILVFKQTTFQLLANTSYKLTVDMTRVSGGVKFETGGVNETFSATTSGTNNTRYITPTTNVFLTFIRSSSNVDLTFHDISVKEIATSYLTQAVSLSAKTWKIIYSVSDYLAGSVSATDYGAVTTADAVGITEYVQIGAVSDFRMVNINGYFEGAVTDISAQLVDPNGYWTLGTGWTFGDDKATFENSSGAADLSQSNILEDGKSYKLTFDTLETTGNFAYALGSGYTFINNIEANTTYTIYAISNGISLKLRGASNFAGSITNISVEQVDPNDYWTLGTGWSIGTDKAISTVTGSNSDITQSILTAGKTYRTVYEIVNYTDGTAQAIVTGSEGADAVAIETYTEDLTTTGTDFSIRSKLGTLDGAVSSVSVKQLGTYEDQSIYVTAADVQTISQASVYYLIELTSMGSKNSLYFLPSSVVPNNGRYTKLNFTVISKDAIQQPTLGIISFYDSVGGLDTYPMGFYEFRIYEQTSSTNLDPLLATGLLEKGFAFVRDFSGNMQELTDGFKEYNPALTQYVYSK